MLAEVQRTLVKSPPELWAELSDSGSLARHLGKLGEIRIVNLIPEQRIEWEGQDSLSGTVELAASGWGTKVALLAVREQAQPEPPEAVPTPEAVAEIEPDPEPEAVEIEPERRPGLFSRLFRRRARHERARHEEPREPGPVVELESEPQAPQPDIAAELVAAEALAATEDAAAAEQRAVEQTTAVLTAVLDRLGAAHHRPFSRA